jgi:[acyl-carrier-protein] S-malonyltransferase
MGKTLLEEFPYAKSVFEEAEDATKLNLRRLCLEGPEAQLNLTAHTQPAILTHSVATWKILQQETGFKPDVFAGHSLGEYSALVAAGVLTLSRAAFLVHKRGGFMQDAVPVGVGGMAAVLNGGADVIRDVCKKVSRENHFVAVANDNNPTQLVIAGHTKAVAEACQILSEQHKARTVILPVSAPFHSQLMKPAKDETTLAPLAAKFIPNISAELVSTYVADYLIEQIDHPVLWTQTMATVKALEPKAVVEVGPGRVLTGLSKRTLPSTCAQLVTDDVKDAIAKLQTTTYTK